MVSFSKNYRKISIKGFSGNVWTKITCLSSDGRDTNRLKFRAP